MKRIFSSFGLLALMAATPLAAQHLSPINLLDQQANRQVKLSPVLSQSRVTPEPLKISSSRQNTVIDEDFSHVPDGEADAATGRRTTYLASHYYEPGRYVNPDYTPTSGTWEGDFVMAGTDGTIVLQTYNPSNPSYIATPLGDYSGDLTITVRARATKSFYGDDESESGYTSVPGSDLYVYGSKGGYDSPTLAKGKDANGTTFRLYPNDGWVEINVDMRIESSDNDGFIVLTSADAIEIDAVKIVDNCTYLASPKLLPETNFTPTSFTINWQPVRRAYNYYLDLWKKTYTSDEHVDDTFDFEDGQVPEGFTAENCEVLDNVGLNSNGCVSLRAQNSSIATKAYGLKLDAMSLAMMIHSDDSDAEPNGIAYVEGLGENGWEKLYTFYSYFLMPDQWGVLNLNGSSYAGKYTALRVSAELDEGTSLCVDDITLTAYQPYALERVWGPYSQAQYLGEDSPYCCYTWTITDSDSNSPTSFTFTDLDPETEYFYRVRSHNGAQFENACPQTHAFGVVTPEFNGNIATDPQHNAYTVSWNDVPKAQKYLVTNYVGEKITQDEVWHSIFEEQFLSAEGSDDVNMAEPMGNADYTPLDDYADNAGWTGRYNIVGKNFLGGADGGELITPPLMANTERGSVLCLLAGCGTYGDNIVYYMTQSDQVIYFPIEKDGTVEAMFEIEYFIPGETAKIFSLNYLPFGITNYELAQDVEQGDFVIRWDGEKEVPAGTGSCTFDGLEANGVYGVSLRSVFTHEGKTVMSEPTGIKLVDLADGSNYSLSGVEQLTSAATSHEAARYTIDGRRASKDYKGIVIVKMSDGTAFKTLAK